MGNCLIPHNYITRWDKESESEFHWSLEILLHIERELINKRVFRARLAQPCDAVSLIYALLLAYFHRILIFGDLG